MKRILLARHAQALPAEGGQDIDRKLSPKGLEDALALGKVLGRRDLAPDYIYCSSAVRTRETCAEILKGLERDIHSEFTKNIYNANAGQLFHMLQSTDPAHDCVMIVGHNPTIYELAVKMSAQGPDHVLNHLAGGYAPASLSVIEAPIKSWDMLDPNACAITDLLDPLDYNAPARPTRWT